MADEKKTATKTGDTADKKTQKATAAKPAATPTPAVTPKPAATQKEPAAPKEPETKAAAAPKMALRISAKPKNGFRRCGVHHPSEAVDYPEGKFTDKQIEILKAEPNLIVVEH